MPRNYWRNNRLIKYLFLFTWLLPATVHAQPDTHAVYWIRYQNQLYFSRKLFLNNDIDNRRFISPDVQNQLIYHSRIHYKNERWDYATGITLSWAFSGRPENPVTHPTLEVRPVIEASYEIPAKAWLIQQRLRIDNRFFEADRFEDIWDGTDYVMRMRYRIQVRYLLPGNSNDNKPTPAIRVADEIMFNHRENFFDQNRIYATLEVPFNKSCGIETGYIYIYRQRFATEQFFERHVLRFSVLHKIEIFK